jgi:purine-nucleoside phosphorylase
VDDIGEVDLAIVLGSGLSDLLSEREFFRRIAYKDIGIPFASLPGHAGHVLVGQWEGKRVLAFAGRVHAYQGFEAKDLVRNVMFAADAGAKTLFVTNAAGALNAAYKPGDLMVIADHINLSGMNPLVGSGLENPFVDMTEAYAPRLRRLAHEADDKVHEGIYAGMLGPTYETAAEARYLRTIGADAVGMSTVLETIAARARSLQVFGISVITNVVGAPATSHASVQQAAESALPRLAALLKHLVARC